MDRPVVRVYLLLSLMCLPLLFLLASCDQSNSQEATAMPTAQSTEGGWLLPTPTLAAGVLTATAGPTATNTPPPTSTPLPEAYVQEGQTLMQEGDYDQAARAFQAALSQPGSLDRVQQIDALSELALAYQREERYAEALETLQQVLRLTQAQPATDAPSSTAPQEENAPWATIHFQMAEVYRALGDCESAIPAYEAYLSADATLAAYIYPRLANCHDQLGDATKAIAASELAVAAQAHRLTEVQNRLGLAERLLAAGNVEEAIGQYDAVRDLAQTEHTRGEMTYLAGMAELQAGNQQAAYDRFLRGVNDYPGSYHSYLGLVELVDGGVPVDDFQRGLVDYSAKAYEAAIGAFDIHIQNKPAAYRAEARLYLAWSYEALGNLEAALAQLDAYAQLDAEEGATPRAAEAAVERGKMLARAGQTQNAIDTYQALVSAFPRSEHAPYAAWWSAVLAEQLENVSLAQEYYLAFARDFAAHEDAPRALFEAGVLAWRAGEQESAREILQQLLDSYAETESGAAALLWLMRLLPETDSEPYVVTATHRSGTGYYTLRALDVAQNTQPFHSPQQLALQADEAQEREDAEAWLASWTGLEASEISATLPVTLTQDGRLMRGERLWDLGLFADAKQEMEDLRQAIAGDALATYQLALYFRDLGLYRSSILAADTIIALSGETVFEAPRLIARLSYPVYYQDLVLRLAQQYGYDPLLQFALVRQESLYESFIASPVGAQGLSQVMPATGEDIARRLGWPNFDNADLYRPFVGLEFGAYYLHQQLDNFDGDVYAALSAYNAGPGNAARWFAQAPHDPDLYLEVVDYRETRSYIQRIYTGYVIYRSIYGDL